MDFLASHRHFCDHLEPLWAELGGRFFVTPSLLEHARALGIDATTQPEPGRWVCVAGIADVKKARELGWERLVYLCHGVGQVYRERERIHDPGDDKGPLVSLFLCPNQATADRLSSRNLGAEAIVVGQPKLSRWVDVSPGDAVAISFRWRHALCPEAGTSLDHYRASLSDLREELDLELLGHGHPRIWGELEPIYRAAGIEPVPHFCELVDRAKVYAVDNSSTLFEWAALDRPTVVLNCPEYRRNVEHGGRFWAWADVGPQVDEPDQLAAAIQLSIEDSPELAERRREVAEEAIAHAADAAVLAVDAIRKHLGTPESERRKRLMDRDVKVRLLVGRAGPETSQKAGDEITVRANEAKRLFESGQAEPIAQPRRSRAERRAARVA